MCLRVYIILADLKPIWILNWLLDLGKIKLVFIYICLTRDQLELGVQVFTDSLTRSFEIAKECRPWSKQGIFFCHVFKIYKDIAWPILICKSAHSNKAGHQWMGKEGVSVMYSIHNNHIYATNMTSEYTYLHLIAWFIQVYHFLSFNDKDLPDNSLEMKV